MVGAAIWIAALAVLGAIVIERGDDFGDRWRLVLLAFLGAPFALALLAETSGRAAIRAAVLGGALPPAGIATMLSYLTALPAFVALGGAFVFAARAASREPGIPNAVIARAILTAFGTAILWVAGFIALFATEDRRCTTFANGSGCTSDVVTAGEALTGLTMLGLAFALAFVLVRLGAARNESPAV